MSVYKACQTARFASEDKGLTIVLLFFPYCISSESRNKMAVSIEKRSKAGSSCSARICVARSFVPNSLRSHHHSVSSNNDQLLLIEQLTWRLIEVVLTIGAGDLSTFCYNRAQKFFSAPWLK